MTKSAFRPVSLAALGVALLLGGCLEPMAGRPSLERRDVELRDRQAEAKAPPPAGATTADPALARDLAAMLTRAEKAEADFALARASAEQSVSAASGAAVGSEAWSVAQTRISQLDAPRRELTQLLGDLETLYVARLEQEASGTLIAGGSAQIDQARTGVLALVERQDAAINALKSSLAS